MKEPDKRKPSSTTRHLARIRTDCEKLSTDTDGDWKTIFQKLRDDTDEISNEWKAFLDKNCKQLKGDPGSETESECESDFGEGVEDIGLEYRMRGLRKEMELNHFKVSHSKIDYVSFFKC